MNTNPENNLRQLASAGLFFGVAALLSLQIREIASSLAGNLHLHGGTAYRVASTALRGSIAYGVNRPPPRLAAPGK